MFSLSNEVYLTYGLVANGDDYEEGELSDWETFTQGDQSVATGSGQSDILLITNYKEYYLDTIVIQSSITDATHARGCDSLISM